MAAFTFLALIASVSLLAVWGGGIFPTAVCTVATVLCGTLAIRCMKSARRSGLPQEGAVRPWLEAACLAALAFLLVTILPLPSWLHPLIGRERYVQNYTVTEAFRLAAQANLFPFSEPWFALTRNRAGTLRMLLLVIAVFGAALLSASLPTRWKQRYLRTLVLAGAGIAVAGYISQWLVPEGDRLWWLFPIPHVLPGPVGCFVNRNHFGGFLALLCPAALALVAADLRERRWLSALAFLVLLVVISLALVFSLSRGALVACVTALAATCVLFFVRRRTLPGLLLVLVFGVVAGALALLPNQAVRERLRSLRNPLQNPSVLTRLSEWRDTLRVWPHYPVIGAGAGALRTVYPQYRKTSAGGWLSHAENQYAELLAEGGTLGAALALGVVAAAIARFRAAREKPPEAVFIGVLGALVVAAVHALFDFPLVLPLYAVMLASMAGLLLPADIRAPRTSALLVALALIGLTATAWASGTCREMRRLDSPHSLADADPRELRQALIWSPNYYEVWAQLGRYAYGAGIERRDRALSGIGERCLTQAAAYDRQNYRLWYQLGSMRLSLGDRDGARAAFARARELRSWLDIPLIPEVK
jgi:O-antigen ligase